jgi:DNA polymerase (family 10)
MRDRLATAAALREIGALLSLQGGERFRARAYRTGAIALEGFGGDFRALVRQGRLTPR